MRLLQNDGVRPPLTLSYPQPGAELVSEIYDRFGRGNPVKLSLLICCFSLIACALGQTAVDSAGQEAKLIALERSWNQAQLARDAHALDTLTSARFVNTEWDGEFSDKAKFLADISDPEFKPSVMNVQEMKIMMYGPTAIVVGIYRVKGVSSGKPYDHLGRFTDTWILEGGKWLCVASHTSLLKK